MSKQEWDLMNLRYNLIVIFHISQGTVWLPRVISQLDGATALIIHCPFSRANVLIEERDLPTAKSSLQGHFVSNQIERFRLHI